MCQVSEHGKDQKEMGGILGQVGRGGGDAIRGVRGVRKASRK